MTEIDVTQYFSQKFLQKKTIREKNKKFMIFQTAVRKYEGIYEKVKVAIFIVFTHRFQ